MEQAGFHPFQVLQRNLGNCLLLCRKIIIIIITIIIIIIHPKAPRIYLDDWLTVHRSITLVDFQLDVQNSYLFVYNTFIKILYIFRALLCSSSGSLRRNCIYAASGIVTLCRWLSCAPAKKEFFQKEFFLNRCTGQSPAESDDTRGCIYTIT